MLTPYRAISVPASAADSQPVTGAVVLAGWSFAETAAATATAQIIDGNDAGGTVIAEIALTASGVLTGNVVGGLHARGGVFVHRLTGTFRYSLWFLPAEEYGSFLLATGAEVISVGPA